MELDAYISELKKAIDSIDRNEIEKISEILIRAYETDKSVFIIGNGGSASTASHFACDLGKGTLERHYNMNKKRFKVYSLTDNVALLTSYGNDLSYEDIFSQQLKNLIKTGDILIVLTGSGNSKNILKAIKLANEIGAITIGLLGFEGGEAAKLLDHKIIIKSSNYGIIEDLHLMLQHILCQKLKNKIN
ncbi:MAG: SIS domain-containing protein [Candidatus Pacearchaeota archaeon]